jgi:hypothetical protein
MYTFNLFLENFPSFVSFINISKITRVHFSLQEIPLSDYSVCGQSSRAPVPLKGPKLQSCYTIRPVWLGDSGTRLKKNLNFVGVGLKIANFECSRRHP